MRGNAAQARRRRRRALRSKQEGLNNAPVLAAVAVPEEGTADESLTTDLDSLLEHVDEVFAAEDVKCADCAHPAAMHVNTEDGDNMGSCSMEGCDCGGFKTTAATDDVETAEVDDPSQGYANKTSLTINFDMDRIQAVVAAELKKQLGESADEALSALQADAGDVEIAPPAPTVDHVPPAMRWSGTIALEGSPTDDGRIFAPGALTWRELPLSLGAMFDTPHADVVTASPVIGRIDSIYRDGGLIRASGIFDDSELGRDVARMVGDGVLRGVSVDVAVSEMEVAYRSDILSDDGEWIGGETPGEKEGPGLLDILFGESADEVMFVMWQGTIGAVTVCPFPAFADAKIEAGNSLVASVQSEMLWTATTQAGWIATKVKTTGQPDALVASGEFPIAPPADWFADPGLEEPTALTVTDDGRVYGHAAAWDVCHIGIPGVCTTAPSSETDYTYFHLKEVVCEDGARVSCGTITLDTGHASPRLGRAEATRHYDDTGTAVADVVCGEDDHGIWFAGAVRSTLNEDQVRKLRGAVLSGDWRNVSGNLELVALLAVNVPGFPVPRTRAMVASAASVGADQADPVVLTLTAAGIQLSPDLIGAADSNRIAAMADQASGVFDDLADQAAEAAA